MRHRVSIRVGGEVIDNWSEYDIQCSMVEPADGFSMTRPLTRKAWELCRPDAEVQVLIDETPMLTGYIDTRRRAFRDGTLSIEGRDKAGRLVQESIPDPSGFDGLMLAELVQKIASPWYSRVELSDTRNRAVRRGKGKKAAVGSEPAILTVTGMNEDSSGRVDPGETRWNLIEQLLSTVQLMCWASVDGRSLIIGKPNYKQAPQYLFRAGFEVNATVKDWILVETIADSFSEIEVHGTSTGDEDNEAGAVLCSGRAFDGPLAGGVGRNFLRPKRLVMSQTSLNSNAEAELVAKREIIRRNFKSRTLQVSCGGHGQIIGSSGPPTIFAQNTMARCIDEDLQTDEQWLLYATRFRSARQDETTEIMLIPSGTEFVA
jgi:prophage tail gpP-like protein